MPRSREEEEEKVAPSLQDALPRDVAYRFDDGALRITLPLAVYGFDAIFRSCYWLTDRAYVYLSPQRGDLIEVTVVSKREATATDRLAWEFLNDLIDQRLRIDINRETAAVREMIVAQAFAEADVVDDRGRALSQESQSAASASACDPKEIKTWRPAS